MSDATDQGHTRRPRRRLWLVLGGLAALVLLLRALLPLAVEAALEAGVRRQTGFPIEVGDVDLWLLEGALAVEGPLVGGRPGEPPPGGLRPAQALLGCTRLVVNLDWVALVHGRLVLEKLELESPRIRLTEAEGGGIDLAFLSALPPADAEAPPQEAKAGEAWPLLVEALVLRDVRLEVGAGDGTLPVELHLAELGARDLVLVDGTLSLASFWLREPSLDVSRRFALDALADGSEPDADAPAPPEPSSDGTSAPLRARIERFVIEGAELGWRAGAERLEVSLDFEAREVQLGAERFPVELELGVEGGTLSLAGELALAPASFAGHLSWRDLPVPPLWLAADPALAAWLRSCRAEGEASLELLTQAGPGGEPAGLVIGGASAVIRAFELTNPGEETEVSVAWDELALEADEIFVPLGAVEPARVALASLRLQGPRLRYTRPAPSLAALAPRGEDSDEQETAPATGGRDAARMPAPAQISLATLSISGGQIEYVDREVTPVYSGRARGLEVVGHDLRWPRPAMRDFELELVPPRGRSLTVTGSLEDSSGTFALDLEALALPPLNPYAAAAGYRLSGGTASLESRFESRAGKLRAENHLVLDELTIDSLRPGAFEAAFGIPLDLMLALLRGPGGEIRLSVPVAVDERGAVGAGFATVVRSALRQAILGAATSPLKAAGFGLARLRGGGISAEPLASPPGEASVAEGERLAAISGLLAARPGLHLSLRGRAGPADQDPLAATILAERAVADDDLPHVADAGSFALRRVAEALRERAAGGEGALEPEDAALLRRLVEVTPVPEARFAALALGRAEAARKSLLSDHDVDPGQLAIGEPAPPGPPGVVLELSGR